ncbi:MULTISPECIES: hypothetical protein [unclassified Aureispira]|uniref:hypothetical protein n=1 Tax=unclassified Aureispira TaxID=2649989 RepID=UPI0006974A40|nr:MULTISPECIES: hypothetical protein [unclassified Aureispira]WMX13070.1 hypothetical protein QP953_19710 [Aureispira sp. CCB-E]
MKPIRKLYEQLGVDKYYKDYGHQYQNPHNQQIETLIINNEDKLDYSTVLDFCAGGGEVSWILKEMGYSNMTGSDPYTHQLYEKNLKQKCYRWSFDDVIKGKLEGNYSSIICSFAMHLCEEQKLYPLTIQLFQHSKSLIILSPHKRPVLEVLSGVELDFTDHALTPKGKKVFLKHYIYKF